MAFLDFGLFKRITSAAAEFELQSQRLGIERRAGELIEHLHRGGWMGDPSYYTEEGILEQFDDFTWWYSHDEEIELTPEIATEVMIQMSDPRSRHFGKMRHETLPPDHLFGRRLEMLTLAVLGQLRATAQLAPHRARVDLRRRADDRAGPRGGRVLRAPPARPGVKALDQSCWTWNRLVVPGRPLGRPAVMPTRWPGLHQPSSTTRRGGVGDQRLGHLVAAHRGRLHAPHQPAAADGLAPGRERVDRHVGAVRGDQARRAPAQRGDDERVEAQLARGDAGGVGERVGGVALVAAHAHLVPALVRGPRARWCARPRP